MKYHSTKILSALLLSSSLAFAVKPAAKKSVANPFPLGYPTAKTSQTVEDEITLNRAIQAYRFFYPTVSGMAMMKGNEDSGLIDNKVFGVLDSKPNHLMFTANSDMPYSPITLTLANGPMVIELPAGPLICFAMDIHQRWIGDMGIPGPDAGKGGQHLILPPDYKGDVPDGYQVLRATSNRVIISVRSMPLNGEVKAAMELIQNIKVHPLKKSSDWAEPKWVNLSETKLDTTPLKWEKNMKFWQMLHDVVESEPAFEGYRNEYGGLAALGIAKGQEFKPDARMTHILEKAAKMANDQMRVEAFNSDRADRVVWQDRKWEWVALRFEDGGFSTKNYTDLEARDRWFYQAVGASPAMFRRAEGQGSVYWLGNRDSNGNFLDGGKTYRLVIPQRVPARFFWSVTTYESETRSEIQTEQKKAALRSLFELKAPADATQTEVYFGPEAPAGKADQWIKTIPGKGWFAYFRVYGPEKAAFDGSWKPGDFEEIKSPLAIQPRSPVRTAEAKK